MIATCDCLSQMVLLGDFDKSNNKYNKVSVEI